jgi:1-acyl-sn-glycerol-3-phosphate acyltransferase
LVTGCVLIFCSTHIQHGFARLWSKIILGTIGVKVQVEGLDKIDTSKPQVYVVNHLSALDIPVLYVHLPFQFRILAKKELFRYPFMGWHLRRSGQIPVVLESPKASVRSLNLAVAAIRHGNSLVIFPEGGRSPDGQLHAFMGGAFYAAVKAQVDVVPIALVGTYEILKMNTWLVRRRLRPRGVLLTAACFQTRQRHRKLICRSQSNCRFCRRQRSEWRFQSPVRTVWITVTALCRLICER